MAHGKLIAAITERLPALGAEQLAFIDTIVGTLLKPATFERNEKSDIVNAGVLRDFGDILRIHHVFSDEPFTKDRFEYALEKACNASGVTAKRAPRGNPGHDLTIGETPCSLKTEASRNIRTAYIHISKFMELGKGDWSDKPADLVGLRDRFFNHMKSYRRIFTLRRLPEVGMQSYELVEIPKTLLEQAANGKLDMRMDSRQMPKPGYCTVSDKSGTAFQLYFDGGTERKLQIKDLRKNLCVVHATWKFPANEPVAL